MIVNLFLLRAAYCALKYILHDVEVLLEVHGSIWRSAADTLYLLPSASEPQIKMDGSVLNLELVCKVRKDPSKNLLIFYYFMNWLNFEN